MFDQIDAQLQDWVKTIADDASVSFDAPTVNRGQRRVCCYLFALAYQPPLRGPERPPLQLALRYLITADAETSEQAHRLLGDLVFAAMQNPEWSVELEPLHPADWAPFALPPQPAFALRIPVRQERLQPAIQRVQKPLEIRALPIERQSTDR
jgi:hypothetical protein